MPASVRMEKLRSAKNGLLDKPSSGALKAEHADSKSGSDLSDVEMEDMMSKAEAEHNLVDDGKEEEDDNSLVVFHCWLCSVEFVDKISIVRHLNEWHKDRPEVHNLDRLMKVPLCMECGVQGPCEHQDGERHEEDEGGTAYMCRPRFLTCRTCPEQFLNAEAVRLHRAKEHPEEPSHQCIYCQEAFLDHPSLVTHNRIHLGGRPYICTTCGNRFSKISDLKRHERIHSGEKPFKCMQCYQTFTQKSSLEKHAKIHAKRSGHLACLLCGLLFEEKDGLMAHAQEMHKGNNFICGICGKMYTEERYLILHEKTHDSDNLKPFPCTFCDRRFSMQHLLQKHEKKMHISKREIKCHLCHKTFKRNENLTRHMLSHSGVKNFQCSECGVGFTEKGSLTRHFKAQHQQIRPHSCPICRRAFTRKSLVRKHVERFHVQKARELVSQRGKFFRCRLCLKLLRKTGKRQHERHHRSKGDVWDGSLEEKLDGDIGDLDSLLGPEVARLLSRKKRGKRRGSSGDDNNEDDENDNEDDEGAEDNNEDLNEDEEEDEENDEEGDDKISSVDGEGDKSFEGEDNLEDSEKSWPGKAQFADGPVFPEFRHIEAEEPSLTTPVANDTSTDSQLPVEDGKTSNPINSKRVESPQDNSSVNEKYPAKIEKNQTKDLEPKRAEVETIPKESSKYHEEFPADGTSKNSNQKEPLLSSAKSTLRGATGGQHTTIQQPQQQKSSLSEGVSPQVDYPSRYSGGKEDLPPQDLRLQQGFRNERDVRRSEVAMFDERVREERAGGSQHTSSHSKISSYSESDYAHQVSKSMRYTEEPVDMKRQSSQREMGHSQYTGQYDAGKSSYHEAMNAYQRMNQTSLPNGATGSHCRESYQGHSKEPGAFGMVEGGSSSGNQNNLDGGEREYREASSVYNMLDSRHRASAGQGSLSANFDDSVYRETAAAYAMMGIPGYPDPRMVGSRSHSGQNYLGMYPWYNDTALTQAIMESRPPLQGMMGGLSYASGSSFVDPRLRDHQGSGSRDSQHYLRGSEDMDLSSEYARDGVYSQEMMSAIARQREYSGSTGSVPQEYRGQGGLLGQQYKAHFAQEAHAHMLRESQQEVGENRQDRGYGSGGAGSGGSYDQGSGPHRSWM